VSGRPFSPRPGAEPSKKITDFSIVRAGCRSSRRPGTPNFPFRTCGRY
jgi:hypothetical protein